jgi:hypothetical protein
MDEAYVHVVTADENSASNGLVAKGAIFIHKLVLEGDGSNALQAQLHNKLTVTGTAEISLAANEQFATEFTRYQSETFDPPMRFNVGLSVDLTGNAGTARIYYSR